MTVTIKEEKSALNKLIKLITSQKAKLNVGFFPKSIYEDGTPIASVAIWNEFGTIENGGYSPPRPFMHPTYEKQKGKWKKILADIIQKQGEKIDLKKALNSVGFIAQQDVQDAIDDFAAHGEPRNAPATIKMKAGEHHGELEESGRAVGDSPLIWKGQMREAVDYEVITK